MAVDIEAGDIAAAVMAVKAAVVVVRRLFGWPPYHGIEFATAPDLRVFLHRKISSQRSTWRTTE